MESPIAELYLSEGEAGLAALPSIGKKMAARIAKWLRAHEITPQTEGSK